MKEMESHKDRETLEEAENIIVPQRYIPFDIGRHIDSKYGQLIRQYFEDGGYNILGIPKLLNSISTDVLFKVEVSHNLRLYIFSYGIGVFMLEDEVFSLHDTYAVDYCDYRKKAHKDILEFNLGDISGQIREIIADLRNIIRGKKNHVRPSSAETWESNGLSYVMTVSYIIKKDQKRNDYEKFSDLDKKNLLIMLQPSLAHKEDTMALEGFEVESVDFDPYNFDVEKIDVPKNWIHSEDCAIYISWAAVILYLPNLSEKHMAVMECLEADLQAMWLYTYCQYINLKEWYNKKKLSSAQLKKEKYYFQRKYNEFIGDKDSSVPVYISDVRHELIRTSGIAQEKQNYMEYITFCIDETESHEGERQRKYATMNEVLLFIIAFIQIAPMLYSALIGECTNLQTGPVVFMALLVVAAIFFIVNKD